LEISWTRLLAIWLGSSTYSFMVQLATFLAGIAIGSYVFERWNARGAKITLGTFAKTQFVTALAALVFLLSFREMPALVVSILRDNYSFTGLLLAQFFTSVLAMLPAAMAFGFNFPAVTLLIVGVDRSYGLRVDQQLEHSALAIGRAYAANTAGAVAAAMVTGFVLLPRVGSFRIVAGTAAVSVLLGLFLAMHSSIRRWPALGFAIAALAAISFCAWSPHFYSPALTSFGAVLYGDSQASRLNVEELADMEDVVFLEDGVSATISVTQSDDYAALKTNGKVDASTADTSTQLLLGDLGAIFHPHPRRVLIIGFGGGMTASAVARFADVERIDCVEIEPAVLRAANYLARLHRGVLSDPRLHMVFDDARNFIQTSRESYDLIISVPSNPWIAGVGSLYTDEFYGAVRKRLAPGGIVVQWLQNYGLQAADFRMILATLAPHFPDVSLWQSANRDYLLLARTDTSPLSFDRSRALWSANPGLKKDFESLRLTHPESWPAYFRLSDAGVRAFAAHSPIDTDDRMSLTYRAARSLLRESLAENLDALLEKAQVDRLPRELDSREEAAAPVASAETAVDLGSFVGRHYPLAGGGAMKSERLLLLGRMALQSGHVNNTLELLDEANHGSDNHSRAVYWLAIAEHDHGSVIQAQTRLDDYLKLNPFDLEAQHLRVELAREAADWCVLGDLHLRAAKLQEATQPLQ
jgi:spermidine synthase